MAVRISKGALKQVRRGHPWIYQDAIVSQSFAGDPGDLAVIFDDSRNFVAIGLFDPASPIRVRVLHAGRPETIDESFFANRVRDAARLRVQLAVDAGTTAYRLINGENDGFPGLIVDRYAESLVVKLYSGAWFAHLEGLLPLLVNHAGVPIENVVLRLARHVSSGECFGLSDGQALIGDGSERALFLENGLQFEADLRRGQKTGHFLDQRDNRRRVREMTQGAEVLDVFSCTGGFTVHAAAGGARSVVSIDRDPHAMAACERNLALNLAQVPPVEHEMIVADAFDAMAELAVQRRRFDVVIVDPPSFAQKQSDIGRALRAYRRLTELALRLLEPGGCLVQASCSSRVTSDEFFDVVIGTADRAAVRLVDVRRTGHGIDHPVTFAEGAYLKALFATVEFD